MYSGRRFFILFLVTGFVLLGSFVALFLIGATSAREYTTVQIHHGIVRELTDTLGRLNEAESAERGYLIEGNAGKLAAYEASIKSLHDDLAALAKQRRRDLDPNQVQILDGLVENELAELRSAVALRGEAGFEAAKARFASGADAGKRKAIASQVAAMLAHEQSVLERAQQGIIQSFRARVQLFLALFVVNMAVLVWSYRRINRESRARQTALNDVRAAKAELEEAGRAKDHFLASLSHELRTPLTPVLAMLSAWQGDEGVPPALREDVQLMRRNVELEARLIDDLLDLTRIAKGKLHVERQVTDVHDVIGAALKVCEPDLRSKFIGVSTECAAARHHANADPARLQQVLWNVLKNATKFTPERGSIRIATANPDPNRLEISITDSGIGMSAETLQRVFEPFEQGDSEVLRRFGGLGLGMTISRALVESHGGTIGAHSDGPGKGSTFTITLPTVEAPAPAAAGKPAQPAGEARRGLRILVVEDHADTADVLRRVLRSRGHEVCVCESVATAINAVESADHDLLLSDLGLPDGSGLELVRQIRQRRSIPAIALTGYGMDDDVARCKDAGFDGHLTKPVSFEKLDAMIGRFSASTQREAGATAVRG